MDMSQIFNAALTLLLGTPGVFLTAVALANLPTILWQVGALAAPNSWIVPTRYRSGQDMYTLLGIAARVFTSGKLDAAGAVGLGISLFSSLLQSAVLVPLIAARYRGRVCSLADALTQARRALPRLCATYAAPLLIMLAAAKLYALSSTAAVIGVVLLVCAFPTWLFLTQGVMLENTTPIGALRRSASLLRRRVISIYGTWLTYELIFVVLTALPTFVMGMGSVLYPPGPRLNALTIIAGNLAVLLIEPLRETMATMLYFEQRRRRREI